jgi:ABC-2 type transport system ATP-binding protein
MNRAIYSIPKNEYKNRLDMMAELLDVGSVICKPTRQLSLGERMKCEFIMAMLHDPKIVFLDEPTIGLDVIAKDRIRDFIREMNSQGKTFILTTHDLGDIEHLAKRVVMINHGSIVFDDSLDALRSYMGARKLVTLSTHAPLPDLGLPGVAVKTRQSDFHAELELDISLTGLNQFIEYVNKSSSIKDISVQAPPIDEVIKNLYQK